jgi:hypothetical protein
MGAWQTWHSPSLRVDNGVGHSPGIGTLVADSEWEEPEYATPSAQVPKGT